MDKIHWITIVLCLVLGQVIASEVKAELKRVKRWKGSADMSKGPTDMSNMFRGTAGVDYPDFKTIPTTSFRCSNYEYEGGHYADVETQCQVYHVCYGGRKESFLCGRGTVFNQQILACDYWYSTECDTAPSFYYLNAEIGNARVIEEKDSQYKPQTNNQGTGGQYNPGRRNNNQDNPEIGNGDQYNSETSNDGKDNSGIDNGVQDKPETGDGHYDPGTGNDGQYNPGAGDDGQYNPGTGNDGQYNPGTADDGQYNPGTADDGQYNPGTADDGQYNPGAADDGHYNSETSDDGHNNPGSVNDGQGNPITGNDGQHNHGTGNDGQFNPETGDDSQDNPGTGNDGYNNPETGNYGQHNPGTGDDGQLNHGTGNDHQQYNPNSVIEGNDLKSCCCLKNTYKAPWNFPLFLVSQNKK